MPVSDLKGALRFVGQFPWLDIKVQIQPITRTILRVTLNIRAQFEWSDRVSGTVEPFWIWVEDNENERIYHTEYFLLHKKQLRETHVLAFTVPLFEPLQGQYIVRAISDRWLHAEHCETIDLRGLVLPEKYPPHTSLLKLCPLPKEALQNEQFQALYRFTHFNAIQTQVFHTLYHTDGAHIPRPAFRMLPPLARAARASSRHAQAALLSLRDADARLWRWCRCWQ